MLCGFLICVWIMILDYITLTITTKFAVCDKYQESTMFNLKIGFSVCALISFNGFPLILSLGEDGKFHKEVSNELDRSGILPSIEERG